MADTYLPADVRKRIVDVMRERKMTQRELALRIDVNESTISRFLSGKTEKLSEESVIRIARVFNVSTDFILGTTVIPDKKNYDISELGLSVEAAKNLYTGKVNNDVVNRLLENPRFAMVTYMIAQYMDDTPVSYTHLDVYKRQGLCNSCDLLSGTCRRKAVREGYFRGNRRNTPGCT